MTNALRPGMRVKFSDAFYTDHGGKLIGTLPDISNGQRTAIIEIDHALPGIVHAVPIIDVTPDNKRSQQ